MSSTLRATLAALVILGTPAIARAEIPPITVGVGGAWNCLGSVEEIPLPYLLCRFSRDGAGGPYLRPYVSVRPVDRLLVTATLGYVRAERQEWPLCCPVSGSRPLGVAVQLPRTAWHGQLTAMLVTGDPTHPIRATVGSGITVFDDEIVNETRPIGGPVTTAHRRASGVAGLFTTGALIRLSPRVEGRLTYTLARRMTATNRPDTSWRHEFGFGVGWRFGRVSRSSDGSHILE
jgi:hypothetical protein